MSHDQESNSPDKFLLKAGVLFSVLLAVAVIWFGGRVLLLSFAGVLVAVFLRALSQQLRRQTSWNHGWCLAAVGLGLLAIAVGLFWLLGEQLTQQLTSLTETLPQSIEQVRNQLSQHAWGKWLLSRSPEWSKLFQTSGTFSGITGAASSVLDFIVDALVIFFVGVYLAAEPELYRNGLLRLTPRSRRGRAEEILDELAHNLRWWLIGRGVAMSVISLLTWLGLWLIGVPLALSLALLAALLQLIPNLGPLLAAVPAILIAASQDGQAVLYVFLLYTFIQIVESYLITPLVQRQAAQLPPAIGIISVVLLGILAGVLGLLVAAPLAIVVIVSIRMLYVEDTLGDRS